MAAWVRLLPWQHVAKLFECSWGTISSAVDQMVKYGLENGDLLELTHIGIDEISREKGHVYLTNVYDLRTCKLVWSVQERSKATLEEFFDFLGPERAAKLNSVLKSPY